MLRPAFAILALLAVGTAARADDVPAKSPRYAALLAAECDDLIRTAVRRPYGWGWADAAAQGEAAAKAPVQSIPVSLEPANTPAAGLLLLYASEFLHEPRYADAARNVARGVAAAQQPTGKFPARALFNPTSASSKEAAAPLPDRAPTRAALALLLSLAEDPDKQPEVINRAASRAAVWLSKQRAESGAFPVLHPPGVPVADATRIVRLDTADTRDCILTLLLSYEVLGDPFHRHAAEHSLAFLLKARTGTRLEVGPGLWQTAHLPTGLVYNHPTDFPPALDTLASRYTAQTFLSVWAVLGDSSRLAVCDLAAKSLGELSKADGGKWHRRYDLDGNSMDPVTAATQPSPNPFGPPNAPVAPPPATDPALAPTLAAIDLAKQLGRDQFRERLAANLTLKQHLALTIAGISDTPMSADFPATPDEVEPWLKRHAQQMRLIDGGIPSDLPSRVERLWAIFLRAQVERQFGA